jgi:hypothetical protein
LGNAGCQVAYTVTVQIVKYNKEAVVSGVNRDIFSINLRANYSGYRLIGLGCLALAASFQFTAVVTHMFDDNGVLTMKTWKFGMAIAATISQLSTYLGALYIWCKALKPNDMRVLARYS